MKNDRFVFNTLTSTHPCLLLLPHRQKVKSTGKSKGIVFDFLCMFYCWCLGTLENVFLSIHVNCLFVDRIKN